MSDTTAEELRRYGVSESQVNLARALVEVARRRGKRESERIEAIARIRLPSD